MPFAIAAINRLVGASVTIVIGDNGFIETAREYWTYNTGAGPVTEKSGQDITVDALREFVRRALPSRVRPRVAPSRLSAG